MRLSLSITNFTWPTGPAGLAQELQAIVEAADGGGIDTVWVNDHLLQAEPGTSRDEPMLEAYTTLGFLASASRRVRLGTMVTGVTFRPVALLVKAVTTVDVLSGGRAWLGIGAGYQQDEARAMGLPLPPTAERFELLADTELLARRMWSGDASLFQGRRTRLEEPIGSPLPLTRGPTDRPGLPILIGGRARSARCDSSPSTPTHATCSTSRTGAPPCDTSCECSPGIAPQSAGRPYEEIDKTISVRFDPAQPVEAFAEHCSELAELGIEHAVALTTGAWTPPVV